MKQPPPPDMDFVIVGDPPKRGFRVTSIWAYLAVGEGGDEGVMGAMRSDGTWEPFIGADEVRMMSIRPFVDETVRRTHIKVKLVRFDQRTDVEEIG